MVRYTALSRAAQYCARLSATLVALACMTVAGPVIAQGTSAQSSVWRPGSSPVHYSVRSGDTLDRIIAQHFNGAPFSVVFLREALARANPQSLPQGARGTLLAGTVMQIPDGCQLRQMAFGDAAECAQPGASGSPPISAQERAEIERRSWVRYP